MTTAICQLLATEIALLSNADLLDTLRDSLGSRASHDKIDRAIRRALEVEAGRRGLRLSKGEGERS